MYEIVYKVVLYYLIMAPKIDYKRYEEIVSLIKQGKSYTYIQERLRCSPGTISRALKWSQALANEVVEHVLLQPLESDSGSAVSDGLSVVIEVLKAEKVRGGTWYRIVRALGLENEFGVKPK